MSRHSLRQQLQAVDFCLRLLSGAIKPNKSEKEFVAEILESIRVRIEQAIDREAGNGR